MYRPAKHRSKLYLAKMPAPPTTILEHLITHFPHIPAETWQQRVAHGEVTRDDGTAITSDSRYVHGITIHYRKEVTAEPAAAAEEQIVYQDGNILVADKPHGMQVTPGGIQVERSLLFRLRQTTGIEALSPAHRLDRETAGLVLFTLAENNRGLYQNLFASGQMEREYLAIAVADAAEVGDRKQWRVENRLESGTPWFRREIVAGKPNAVTDIEWVSHDGRNGLFRLRPQTGKKHQLRVHMTSIGFPILGDPLYPDIRNPDPGDPTLQLLAHRLAFIDPITGKHHLFVTTLQLSVLR